MLVIPDGLPVVAVVIPAAIVTVDNPAVTFVIVAPEKLIAVIAEPTELPDCLSSTPEITLLKLAPSP